MNVLFLTTGTFHSINEHYGYPDLLREFKNNGHEVYVVSTYERRLGKETEYVEDDGAHLLRVRIGNLTKTGFVEKGISTLLLEHQFTTAIKKYLSDVRFDLILYSTPPITLVGAIEYVKRKDKANTYLLLKDIFPQNAVDIGLMKTSGIKGALYRYFRAKEKKLYKISDYIGCMSKGNVEYLLTNNQEIDQKKVDVCPNCIEVIDKSVDSGTRLTIRKKYDIPLDKKVYIYGGNLGKPQDIPFVIECLKACKDLTNVFFLIVGDGTEFALLEEYVNKSNQQNFKLMKRLPREDYDTMVGACDVGMIFLDHRFTIPNFPSRILSYMQAKIPVLACTDSNTDVGKIIEEGDFGWWCESTNTASFYRKVIEILEVEARSKGENGWDYLNKMYTSQRCYTIIVNSVYEGTK